MKRTIRALAFTGVLATASPVLAQAISGPTREEIQRERLDERLSGPGQALEVADGIERAPCPLSNPDFAGLRFTLRDAEFAGLGPVDQATLEPAYRPYVGQELAIATVCEIRDRAATILRRAGYLAAVQIPPQTIEDGTVRFDVVLARIAEVQVRGDPGPSGALLQRYVDRLRGQQVFNSNDAERALLLARDIPGLDVRLSLQPMPREGGGAPGDVVGIINVERQPVYADLTVQNYGSKSVGREGALASVRVNGITGLGDETQLSFFVTGDFDEQQVVQAGHSFFVGSDGLRLGGGYTHAWTHPDLVGPDPFKSQTSIGTVYGAYPFLRRQNRNLFGTIGLEIVDQEIEFSGLPFTEDDIRVAFARLDFSHFDAESLVGRSGYSAIEPRWAMIGSLEVRQGLDMLGASPDCRSTPAACTATGAVPPARLTADPTAFVVRGEAQLDFRPVPLLKLTLRPRAQWSPDALFSYEQLSGGNYTAGRGFDPGAVIGDSGYGFQAEVAYGSLVPATPRGIALQPFGFFDLMSVHTKGVAGDPQTIKSAGGGLRATLGRAATLDLVGAIPLDRAPLQTSRGDARLLFNLTVQLAPWVW